MAIVGSLVGIYYLVVAQHRHALVSLRTKLHCARKEAENKMHYSFYLGDCGSVESMFHLERRNKENKEEKKEERKKQKRGGDKNEGRRDYIVRAQWTRTRLYRKKEGA